MSRLPTVKVGGGMCQGPAIEVTNLGLNEHHVFPVIHVHYTIHKYLHDFWLLYRQDEGFLHLLND